MNKLYKKCLICNQEFQVWPNPQSIQRKYCSRGCYVKSIKGIKRPSWVGKKVSEAKMGHGWPEGYSQRQSIAQKRRFTWDVPWNKDLSLIKAYDNKSYGYARTKEGATKKALDAWAKSRIPKPDKCEMCGLDKPLEMSNKSQKYKRDVEDWQWICKKCHRNYDGNAYKAWITRKKNDITMTKEQAKEVGV